MPLGGAKKKRKFQLTPSRRATHSPIPHQIHKYISTHALTEGDSLSNTLNCLVRQFQLTPSRRATKLTLHEPVFRRISTHALTEGDALQFLLANEKKYFNSRPHGGRQTTCRKAALF